MIDRDRGWKSCAHAWHGPRLVFLCTFFLRKDTPHAAFPGCRPKHLLCIPGCWMRLLSMTTRDFFLLRLEMREAAKHNNTMTVGTTKFENSKNKKNSEGAQRIQGGGLSPGTDVRHRHLAILSLYLRKIEIAMASDPVTAPTMASEDQLKQVTCSIRLSFHARRTAPTSHFVEAKFFFSPDVASTSLCGSSLRLCADFSGRTGQERSARPYLYMVGYPPILVFF